MSPCLHFSMFPCLHVSMSPFFHVSMFPCLHLVGSMSTSLHFWNSVKCITELTDRQLSFVFCKRKTETENFRLFCCKRKRKTDVCFPWSANNKVIDDSADVPTYDFMLFPRSFAYLKIFLFFLNLLSLFLSTLFHSAEINQQTTLQHVSARQAQLAATQN